jgi:ketosteroid isomerase-like protein
VEHARYVDNLRSHPAPTLALDQVVIHVDGDTAIASGRTSRRPGTYRRYLDTYERRTEGWRCVHACVWPLELPPSESGDEQSSDAQPAKV